MYEFFFIGNFEILFLFFLKFGDRLLCVFLNLLLILLIFCKKILFGLWIIEELEDVLVFLFKGMFNELERVFRFFVERV